MPPAPRSAALVPGTRARFALRAGRGDEGFALLESMVAITIVTIVMAALGSFYVRAVGSSNLQRARQVAIQVADGAVDAVRSYPASDLVSGRDQGSVDAQFQAAPTAVTPWLQTMNRAYDTTATGTTGTNTALPMPTVVVTQSPGNGVTYSVSKYLGQCWLPQGASAANCTNTTQTGVQYWRAVVSVSWTSGSCVNDTCYYVTATLINGATDPTFNLNQIPRPAPVIVNPGAQTSQVGDVVSLQLQVQDGTGVPTFTWSSTSTFPAALSLSATGLITGTAGSPTANASIAVTVTDGFLQTATATFTWTVVPKLAVAAVSSQASTTGTAIGPLTLTATGGTGSPYTWSDPQSTLPPGLVLGASTGQITGTPNTPGGYQVQIQVADGGGHTAAVTWMWNVYAPLALGNPGNQTNIVSTAINPVTLGASGGSGSYRWSITGTPPAGISFANGQFTGTPTSTTATPPSLTVTLTDTVLSTTKSVTFTWNIVPPLVITGNSNQTSYTGTALTGYTLTASGGAGSPYSWTDPNGTLPPGLTLSTTATYQGKVTGTPTTPGTYAVSLKATDSKGLSTWTSFTWTVYSLLVVTNPGNQSSTVNTAIANLPVAASGGSGSYTFSATGLPAGLRLSPAGVISGTPTATGTASVTITVSDPATAQTKTATFSWLIAAKPTVTAPGNQTTTTTATITTVQLGGACQNAPCTYTLNNGPAGLSVNATGAITGTVTSAAQVFPAATVTVRDAAGVSATTAPFSWTVYALPTVTSPGNRVTTVGATVSIATSSTCPNGPCTYALNSGPAGLSASSTGSIVGTVGTPAQTYPSSTVTIRDAAGVTAASSAFSWVVNAAPAITNPGNQTTYLNTNVSIDIKALDSGGTAPYTYAGVNLPSWLSVDPTTGVLSGKTPSTKTTVTNIALKETDASGVSATSAAFSWTVTDLKTTFGDQMTAPSTFVSVDLDNYTSGGTSPYTFSISNRPSWLSYSSFSHVLSGTAPSAVGNYLNVVVAVTDSAGVTISTPQLTWHVSTLKWNTTVPTINGKVGTAFGSTAASAYASGGSGSLTWTANNLPPGITINSGTSVVSGTPTRAGSYSVTITATDSLGAWATSNTFTWTVAP